MWFSNRSDLNLSVQSQKMIKDEPLKVSRTSSIVQIIFLSVPALSPFSQNIQCINCTSKQYSNPFRHVSLIKTLLVLTFEITANLPGYRRRFIKGHC